jgi:hypothetical protein
MEQQLYKKVGRKYIPIGYSDGWVGFPSDGIWIVQSKTRSKSSECILKIGELTSLHPFIDLFYSYQDKITNYLQSNVNVRIVNRSYHDFVVDLLKEISK